MRKLALIVAGVMVFTGFAFSAAFAQGEKTDFVCPVFNDESAVGDKNPVAIEIGGGDYTIVGSKVGVPTGATNGDGAGIPGDDHSAPGDTDYTAIWSGE